MRGRIRLGRYILLLGVVAAVLYMSRGRLRRTERPEPPQEMPESAPTESSPSASVLEKFPGLRARTIGIQGDTLFFKNGGVALLGGGDLRVALAILDTLLALHPDFDTIDLRIKGHAVVK